MDRFKPDFAQINAKKQKTNSFLDKMTIKMRLIILVLIVGLVFCAVSIFIFSNKFSQDLYKQKENQISYLTEAAVSIMKMYSEQVKEGKLSLKDAQAQAKHTIADIRFEGQNYLWINDYDGIMIQHPKTALVGKDTDNLKDKKTGKAFFTELNNQIIKNGYGKVEYYWDKPGAEEGKLFPKYSVGRGYDEWKWVVAGGVYVDDVANEVNKSMIMITIASILALTVIGFASYFTIGRSIILPLESLANVSLKLAENDLSVQIEEDNNNTEIGNLNRAFRKFTENLKSLVDNIKSSSEKISSSSNEISSATDQTAQGANQVAISTSQLASGAQEISRSIEDSLVNIGNVNQVIQVISEESRNISELGNSMEYNANKGREYVDKAVNKITNIKSTAEKTSENLEELGQLSSQISQIVDLIKSIAGQTNLLALNAAIEAARAGEHGKGFAVVADEVKKLATQSAEATDKITEMIKEIQIKTSVTIDNMNKGVKEVEEGVVVVGDTGTALENIIEQVKLANSKIQEITVQIGGVAASSDGIVKMMENVSSIVEETAASSEEISSISQEQTASTEEISASFQTLYEVAKQLHKQIEIFKL